MVFLGQKVDGAGNAGIGLFSVVSAASSNEKRVHLPARLAYRGVLA